MNVSKSNYFVGYMFLNGEPVEYNHELLETGKIKGIHINDENYSAVFDHAFYIDNADDFMCYENAYNFCDLMTSMALDEFGDKYLLEDGDEESIMFVSYNSETDDPQYIIMITLDIDGDIFIDVYDVNEIDEEEDFDDEDCDGDCEYCSFYSGNDFDDDDLDIIRHILFDYI